MPIKKENMRRRGRESEYETETSKPKILWLVLQYELNKFFVKYYLVEYFRIRGKQNTFNEY